MRPKRQVVPQTAQLLSLLLALLVVLAIAVLSYRGWVVLNRRNQQADIAQSVLERTNGLLSALKDAEAGQRGYLLTGRAEYLEPYRKAAEAVPGTLQQLGADANAHPDQARRVEQLKLLVASKLSELKRTIEIQNSQGPEAALAIVLNDRGKDVMDEIRQSCALIEAVAKSRLAAETDSARVAADGLELIGALGSALLFGLLVLSTIAIQRGANRRNQLIIQLEESEEKASEARDWLRTTLASIGDGVIATDERGRVTFMNAIAQSLTGWQEEQAKGRHLDDVFAISDEENGAMVESPVAKALRGAREAGLANHTTLTAKDGRRIPIDDSAAPIQDDRGKVAGVVLVFRDIAQRREAEARDKQASAALGRLAAIVESSQDAIIGTDLNGNVTSWNRGAERLFGYSSQEMIGRSGWTLAPPDRQDELRNVLERIRNGESLEPYQTIRKTKSGAQIHVAVTVSAIQDSKGAAIGVSKIARDITERVLAETERTRQAGLLARTVDDLQQFAYAASHDLKEPLRTISAFSDLLVRQNQGKFDAQSLEYVQFIKSASVKMKQLVDALLQYSQAGEVGDDSGAPVDLEKVFSAVLASLGAAIEESRAIVTHDPLPLVAVDEMRCGQLLQNLIGNALKYRSEAPPQIHVSAQADATGWIVSVSDNGQGIAPEYQSRVFELFRRLHGQDYPGTGIGLAMCRKIVNRYGGRIWVSSETGKGSTFYFTAPAAG